MNLSKSEKTLIVHALGSAIELEARAIEVCTKQEIAVGSLEIGRVVKERQKQLREFEKLRQRLTL